MGILIPFDDGINSFKTHLGILFTKKVCYGRYGCFRRGTSLPRILVELPEAPSVIETKFHLFTRSVLQSTLIDDSSLAKLSASNFEISRQTIFVIHGFSGKYL